MPVYDYVCNKCQQAFSVTAKMSDPKPNQGPGCQQGGCELERKFTSVACIGNASKPASATREANSVAAPAQVSGHKCGGHCSH